MSEINKYELSHFLNVGKHIFDDFLFDFTKRTNYDDLKSKYPLSNIMYINDYNFIHNLSINKNKIYA